LSYQAVAGIVRMLRTLEAKVGSTLALHDSSVDEDSSFKAVFAAGSGAPLDAWVIISE
jgi:hypothetical protein